MPADAGTLQNWAVALLCVCQNRRNGYKSWSFQILTMFGLRKRNREQHRYYLLPGMGKCNKRRYKQWVRRSFVVGIIVSAIFGYLIYHFNRY
jgi:hypothetical protein